MTPAAKLDALRSAAVRDATQRYTLAADAKLQGELTAMAIGDDRELALAASRLLCTLGKPLSTLMAPAKGHGIR